MSVILTELKLADQRFTRLDKELQDVQHTIRAIIAQLETASMRAASPLSVSEELAERYESGDM